MRYALDIRPLGMGPSGDRSHLLGLLGEFGQLAPHDEFLLCTDASAPGDPQDLPQADNYSVRHLPARPGWLWTPVVWPLMLRRERAQLAHGVYLVPPCAPCPTVVSIHDVSFMPHPEWFPRRQLHRMRVLIPLSARRATTIVTLSEHAADEIVTHLHVPRRKVVVIPAGVNAHFTPMPRAEAREWVRVKFGLRDRYLLSVGLLQPRKNLIRLLEAFALLQRTRPELKLAVVGATGWGTEPFHQRLRELQLEESVVLCGSVSEDDLRALYSAAAVFVYPSLYEGFGLPPLEAMRCGTPVAAADATAIPEVVGDAAVRFDPLDVEAMAAALAAVLDDRDLASRLVAAGLERARQFSWRTAAAAYLRLFAELAG